MCGAEFVAELPQMEQGIWVLAQFHDVRLVWFAFPIAEVVSFTLSIIFTLRITKKVINHIGEEAQA